MVARAGREVVAGAGRGDNSQPKTEQNRGKTEEGRKTKERWRQQGTSKLDGGGGDVRWLDWAATKGWLSGAGGGSEKREREGGERGRDFTGRQRGRGKDL